jgi:hypothetical protein
MAKNAYQQLQASKKKECEGKITKTQLNEAGKKYVARSTKKGMDENEAKKKAKDVMDDTCAVSGVKKRKTSSVGTTITAKIKSLKAQIGKLEKAVKAKSAVKGVKPAKSAVKGTKAKAKRK